MTKRPGMIKKEGPDKDDSHCPDPQALLWSGEHFFFAPRRGGRGACVLFLAIEGLQVYRVHCIVKHFFGQYKKKAHIVHMWT